MTRREKLIKRIVRRPPSASFTDVQNLLEDFGWILDRSSASHMIFVKPGEAQHLSVPVHDKRVKRFYLDKICKQLGLDQPEED